MTNLNSEIKAMFARQLSVIATSGKDGKPNIGPKGSLHIIDDETLAYSETTGQKTLANIRENPRVAVLVVDREGMDGYQIKGTAEILTGGELYEQVARRQEQRGRPRPEHVVKVKIEEIYSVKPGMTAKKIE